MPLRIILIDPDDGREALVRRLRAQGYDVQAFASGVEGTTAALESPPDAVIADLWMEGVSGLQLARLLSCEPATEDVPIVLRAPADEPRTRFWARHAGATGYVAKGRFGELVRTLRRVVVPRAGGFFFGLGEDTDLHARISHHLDRALFDAVVASEIRALGTVGSFERLVDAFSQLMVQITSYRWLAVGSARRLGVHARPERRHLLEDELVSVFGAERGERVWMEDDDADASRDGPPPLVAPVRFGALDLGTLAIAPDHGSRCDRRLVDLAARELGGALRIVALMEETQRLAVTDTLTGLMRRAPFADQLQERLGGRLWVLLLDLDRFKQINDHHGHSMGDRVLRAVGERLAEKVRPVGGMACRWGGEEFVVALPGMPDDDARAFAESLRRDLHEIELHHEGARVPVSASIGMASGARAVGVDDLIDHADVAMYLAKTTGRDRVCDYSDTLAAA